MEGIGIQIIEQKIFALAVAVSRADAQQIAMSKRTDAFGLISKLFYRPQEDDIQLCYTETRYEPFWHVVCQTRLEYRREREYQLRLDREVVEVTVGETVHPAQNHTLTIKGIERCVDDQHSEVCIDAHTGRRCQFSSHVSAERREIQQTEELMVDDQIVVPAKVKASIVVREMLSQLFKPVSADDIVSQSIVISNMNLYFRPVHAFEFQWASQDKQAVFEIDAVSGDWVWGRAIKQKLSEIFTEENLFELGGETLGLVVPGGTLAVKLARAVITGRS